MFGILVPVGGGDDIPLKKEELIVGRNENCDIVLRFKNVSAKHCRLVLSNGYWYVLDLGSTNGTKINNARIQDRRIDPNSIISIAKNEYYIQYNPLANGAGGTLPPDFLETNIFEKSLLERAGLVHASSSRFKIPLQPLPKQRASLTDLEDGKLKIDYSKLTLDDIEFEK